MKPQLSAALERLDLNQVEAAVILRPAASHMQSLARRRAQDSTRGCVPHTAARRWQDYPGRHRGRETGLPLSRAFDHLTRINIAGEFAIFVKVNALGERTTPF